MLSKKQVEEIREHLEKAQRPLFFFDNDCDGLTSFLMLRKYIDRGKGVAVKASFEESYFRKVIELEPDYIFILDRPNVAKRFIEKVREKNLPIVWIDHHDVPKSDLIISDDGVDHGFLEGVFYYNSFSKGFGEPVSYVSYKIVGDKKFDWLAMIGCIADNFVPNFYNKFIKKYPELFGKNLDEAFDVLYQAEFGKIIQMLDFALKDRTSNVLAMINFLIKSNSPFDILKESHNNVSIHKRYEQINSVYLKILERAKKVGRRARKVLFFEYGGELSLSANLANELSYCFPGKVIVVSYVKGESVNLSIRGDNIKGKVLKVLEGISGARGGGHQDAVGAKMSYSDFKIFKNEFIGLF